MRGPQFMLGYWKEPQATASVLRDGWYWSGDIVNRDANNFFYVLDRRKEMIKYKGFPVAPAEVEAVLMEHPRRSRLRSRRAPQSRGRRNSLRLRRAARRPEFRRGYEESPMRLCRRPSHSLQAAPRNPLCRLGTTHAFGQDPSAGTPKGFLLIAAFSNRSLSLQLLAQGGVPPVIRAYAINCPICSLS